MFTSPGLSFLIWKLGLRTDYFTVNVSFCYWRGRKRPSLNPNQLISEMLKQTDQRSLCSHSVLLVLSQERVTGNSANTAGPGGWGGVIRCSHTCCLTSSQNNLCGQHPLTVLRQGTSDRSGGWPGGTQPAMTQPGSESLSILLYLLLFLSCPK